MRHIAVYYFLYLLIMSLITYFAMAYDKKMSKRSRGGKGRIRERSLLLLGLSGGAAGGWLAMARLRHKSLHKRFEFGFPLFTLLHIVLIFYLIGRS